MTEPSQDESIPVQRARLVEKDIRAGGILPDSVVSDLADAARQATRDRAMGRAIRNEGQNK